MSHMIAPVCAHCEREIDYDPARGWFHVFEAYAVSPDQMVLFDPEV